MQIEDQEEANSRDNQQQPNVTEDENSGGAIRNNQGGELQSGRMEEELEENTQNADRSGDLHLEMKPDEQDDENQPSMEQSQNVVNSGGGQDKESDSNIQENEASNTNLIQAAINESTN